ncbi:hypothetical protein [Amycolatopsis sp. cmx-8-4]
MNTSAVRSLADRWSRRETIAHVTDGSPQSKPVPAGRRGSAW